MPHLIKKIQNFSFQNELWQVRGKIIVGVSGGPDSVCLLDILAKLAPKYDLRIYIAHVNYGLRGKDSDKDEEFTKNLAKKYDLPINTLQVKKVQIKKGANLEENLRQIRYDFFEKIRKEKKLDLIAVAHNMDDQAETLLMRIIRGSGLQGLGSMRPKNNFLIRPLLATSRKEILAYLEKNELNYQIDTTNTDTRFLRNKIRFKLIPYLEKNYNSSIKKILFSSSLNIANDYNYIENESGKALKKSSLEDTTGKIILSIKKISSLPQSLQRQSLRIAISLVKNSRKDIIFQHTDELIKMIKSKKNKSQKIKFEGLKISRSGDRLTLACDKTKHER